MKKVFISSAIGLTMAMSGCTQMVWVKEGATPQQFNVDQFDCKQKAYTMVGGYDPVKNFGTLAVNAPGFFNECMQAKGYVLQRASRQITTQEELIAWLEENVPDGNRMWSVVDPTKWGDGNQLISDYRSCEANTRSHRSKTCMEALGYHSIYRATFKDSNLKKPGVTDLEHRWDKVKCTAPTIEETRDCMRAKGYVSDATVAQSR